MKAQMLKKSINLLEYFLNNTDDSYHCVIYETRENIKELRKELNEIENTTMLKE